MKLEQTDEKLVTVKGRDIALKTIKNLIAEARRKMRAERRQSKS